MEVATVSYNGSGTFQINTTGQPVVTGTVISSTAFNALTADLATGLSTAITKDGQTATTARIPFAAGINSSLVTDSSSTSTGSIITAGGVGIAKAAYIGTTLNVASTASASKLIPTGSSVTGNGLYLPAANSLGLSTNGTNAVYIDSSQNVGIGTTSPSQKVTLGSGFVQTGNGTGSAGGVWFPYGGDASTRSWRARTDMVGFGDFGFEQSTTQTGTTFATKMLIDASGNLTVSNGTVYFTSSQYRSNVASSQLQFINNSAGVSLAVNGTSWGSLSDERDKEIIEPIIDAISKVLSLRSVIGRYKIDDEDKRRAFLIAQDVKAVLPEAVTELDDEQKTLILQYTEIIPLLVASIKEQQTLITALTARITALENK